MKSIKEMVQDCRDEMGPKVFQLFCRDLRSDDLTDPNPMIPCVCKGTGFSDCVNRGVFAMEPKELLCRECKGRGWKVTLTTTEAE